MDDIEARLRARLERLAATVPVRSSKEVVVEQVHPSVAPLRTPSATLLVAAILIAAVAVGVDLVSRPTTPGSTGGPSAIAPASTPPGSTSPARLPLATEKWGPLAVIPPQDGADTARTEGTLRITDTCVFLVERGGGPVLLVWPADRTTWDAGARTITFANFDGTSVSVGDGMRVVLMGGGGGSSESGIAPEVWLAGMTWVARPVAGCPVDPHWGVGGLALN